MTRPHGATLAALLLSLWWLGCATQARARTFADSLSTPIEKLFARSLAQTIARSLPVTAASAGVSYTFDPETGAFTRETSILGQLFLERAAPVGRGKLNINVNYQHVQLDTFDGEPLRHLSDTTFPIIDPNSGRPFVIPRFGIRLDTNEATASATYGVTDDLDLNLTVPVVDSAFGLDIRVVDVETGRPLVAHIRSSKLGVADIFLRGKYRVLARDSAQLALGLVLRLPAGNQDNFQGTGAVELAPMLYASRAPVPVASWLKLLPYLNGGVNFDTPDVGDSEGRYGLGLDGGIVDRATVAIAFLGRQPFRRVGRPGLFDVVREDQSTGRRFVAPLFGVETRRPNFFDLSVGGRVNLWRDTVIGFANAIVPLNRDGFRSDVIPTVGIEATF